jgi:uncharacterized protein YndB with AHSA1/START domain
VTTDGFVVAVDRTTGEVKAEGLLASMTTEQLAEAMARVGVDPDSIAAFTGGKTTKARHASGRYRPVRPDEKLGLTGAWQHGGAVHPALRP